MPVIINGTTGVTFPNGVTMSDGTSAPVTIAQGGTGANTAANARTALGTNDAANITTGAVAIANGGTGQTTRQAAMDALAGAVTAGRYLRGDGTDVIMDTLKAADMTGTLAVANGGTGTTTPSLVAGSNISISGTWPNQTVTGTTGAPTTAQVLSAYAGATAGGVGTYVFCTVNANTNFNSNVSGSSLRAYSGVAETYVAIALSGTWKCVGSAYINDGNQLPLALSNNQSYGSLWLRIS
jgi:hypothetical protein